MIMTRDGYEIDDDTARLDLAVVHGFVAGSYWAAGVPRDVVARSVANSLNLGLYHYMEIRHSAGELYGPSAWSSGTR
jgi:hypothetical protein